MNDLLFVLYGPDRLPIQEKTEILLDEHGIPVSDAEVFDMEEVPVEEAVTAAMTIPFLADRKAVVLRNAYFLTAATKPQKEPDHHLDRLAEYVTDPNPTTLMILQATGDRLDARKAICRLLSEKAVLVGCLPPKREDSYASIRGLLADAGFSIDADALEEFVIRTRESEGLVKHELEKLVAYGEGKDTIDVRMVREVVTKNLEDNVFDLVNAYLAKDAWTVTTILQDLLKAGTDPNNVAQLMAGKFQEILYAKELLRTGARFDDVMKYFGASKGRTYYIMKNANENDDAFVLDRLDRLELLDFQMKSGAIDKKIGLETFLYRLE
jgi:DNA polymerase-3 subunit delta